MKKEFSFSNEKFLMNFSSKYCDTQDELLNSRAFQYILERYIELIKGRGSKYYITLENSFNTDDVKVLSKNLVELFSLLTIFNREQILGLSNKYEVILKDKEEFVSIVENIYSFWRKLERYSVVIKNSRNSHGIDSVKFREANEMFSALVLSIYRKIEKNILLVDPLVYRQIAAGSNVSIILNKVIWPIPKGYEILDDILFIDTVIMETPFITYPKKNTRDGYFKETFENPLHHVGVQSEHWYCFPVKIGNYLSFIYFHRDFISHGVSLCNLFEIAMENEYVGKKPDIVLVFGVKDNFDEVRTVFYDDTKNDIMLGYINYSENIDYFGYMKKMSLTLHNLISIKKGNLPVHGAMVSLVMNNGKSANVIIIGDSGAGKSESLEAFRGLSEGYIRDLTIVFDDMGSISLNDDLKAYGTEIGAFVRLDDLERGYAFKELDRSVYMNPDKTNARLIMPVSRYNEIIKGYNIDFVFYANNYELANENEKHIEYFSDSDTAIEVFKEGKRMSKGTTTENGVVKSYFANPFGPHQKQEECDILLKKYFDEFFKRGIKVGQIKTCLGIKGMEKLGPENAARELFEIINNL